MEGCGALRYVRHCHTPRGAAKGRGAGLDGADSTETGCLPAIFSSSLPFPVTGKPLLFKKKSVSPRDVLEWSTVFPAAGLPWAAGLVSRWRGEGAMHRGGPGEREEGCPAWGCAAGSGSVTPVMNRFPRCLSTDHL